jgi:hypothetical protein
MNTGTLQEFKFRPTNHGDAAVLWKSLLPMATRNVIDTLCKHDEFRVTVHPHYLILWSVKGDVVYSATSDESIYRKLPALM